MVEVSRLTKRMGAVLTRLATRHRFRTVEHVPPRPRPVERTEPPWPNEGDAMLEQWIRLGAHLEELAPPDISPDELSWVEDAAAERIHQAVRAHYLR
jgi:hypothetical protein